MRIDRRQLLRAQAALGLLGVAGCSAGGSARELKTLRFAVQLVDMTRVHSNPWPTSYNLVNPVLDCLCTVDPNGLVKGALAERWEVSEDLLSWTFHLRRGVPWRKGGFVTADQVLWNWRRWVDPAVGSAYMGPVRNYMMNVEPARPGPNGTTIPARWTPWDANLFEKIDDYTVRVNLKAPAVTVAEDLFTASSFICDPEEEGVYAPGCNGTGPFTLESYRVHDQTTFVSHDKSWRGRPKLDRFQIVDVGGDYAAAAAALVSRQIHSVLTLPAENALAFENSREVNLVSAPSAQSYVCRMQCDHKPFDDPRVRKAMRLAVDCRRANLLVQGKRGSIAEHHHVSPTQPDYPSLPPFPYDPVEARRLLAEAGYPDGFSTTINCNASTPGYVKLGQVLSEMWAAIGVRCAIQVVTADSYTANWREYPLSITLWTHRPAGVMTLALSYRTGAPWNESHYSNPEFDRLIDEAQTVLDPVQRREVMGRACALLQEDGPLVQPIWSPSVLAVLPLVGGLTPHPMSYYPAEHLSFDA